MHGANDVLEAVVATGAAFAVSVMVAAGVSGPTLAMESAHTMEVISTTGVLAVMSAAGVSGNIGAIDVMGAAGVSVAALVLRAAGFSGPAFALGAAFAMSVMGVACVWRSIIHGAIVQGAPVSQALLSS